MTGAGVTVTRAAKHNQMLWANGRGSTLELAREPRKAELSAIEWRISVATLGEPGPFSHLPGLDRTLMVLDDALVVLDVDGAASRLGRFDQVEFSGESATALVDVWPKARDLNVMCRRGRWKASIAVQPPEQLSPGLPDAGVDVCVVLEGSPVLLIDGVVTRMQPLDMVRGETPSSKWSGTGLVAQIRIRPVAGNH